MQKPEADAIEAETFAREALSLLRAAQASPEGDEGRGTGDAAPEDGTDALGDAEAAGEAPSAAGNLARVEAQRQREWLYRGYRRSRGGWNRD